MASCMSCGSGVPSGQDVCSMCYGDMDYGDDGYYQDWLEREREDERNWESQMELLERIEEIKSAMLSNFAAWQLAKAQLVAKEAIFKEQNADLIAEEKEFRESYSEQEEELRLLIVEVYNATGNRIPSEHLGIRMNKYILYDKADAMQFGRETGIGISLNTREFEKYAKDNPAEVTFAVMEEAPSATISKALYA